MNLEAVLGSYAGGGGPPKIYENRNDFSIEYRIPDVIRSLNKSIGLTDKLLKEMEDWGYFHFKTVFRKLDQLSPLGAASRYLQELYIAMVKSIKH